MALAGAGRLDEALAAIERQVAKAPHDPAALGLQAALLSETGNPDSALAVFDKAIALDPRNPVLHSNHGNALVKLQRPVDAVESFCRAIALNPGYAAAWTNRAAQQVELRNADAALGDADRALALNPVMAAAHRTRGRALLLLSRCDEALASFDAALALQPANAGGHVLRAEALSALGRYVDSVASFEQGVALSGSVENRCHLALARLRLGDFRRGWIESEARWDQAQFKSVSTSYPVERLLPLLDRDGRLEDIFGKKVLVIDEQGIGDQVMFCSMLPDLIAAGCEITCFCDSRLLALLSGSFPVVRFLPQGGGLDAPLESFQAVIAMGSLGRLFRNASADFPGEPYLKAPQVEADVWRMRLGPKRRPLRIGISWRGGLEHTNRASRSLMLDQLLPILSRPDCEFVSLQYGDATAQIIEVNERLGEPITALQSDEFADFSQLAGLLQSVDLVVSVQTSLIHLCGALGVPCLVMVPFVAEWRYGAAGDKMPWYSSVRLFRQAEPGAWGAVIEAVERAIDAWPKP